MKPKLFLIDTSKCIGCRGCQVACKVWNNLEPEDTKNWGSYQNPGNMSGTTYTLVRFSEVEENGKLRFLFSKDQCRHCEEAGCMMSCPVEGAIYRWEETGAVFVTDKCDPSKCERECIDGCPYEVMKFNEKSKSAQKCRLCPERIVVGEVPACVKTCPTGALSFGDMDKQMKYVKARVAELKKKYPSVDFYPGEGHHVGWILTSRQKHYHLAEMDPRKPGVHHPRVRFARMPASIAAVGACVLGGLKVLGDRKAEIREKEK